MHLQRETRCPQQGSLRCEQAAGGLTFALARGLTVVLACGLALGLAFTLGRPLARPDARALRETVACCVPRVDYRTVWPMTLGTVLINV